MRDILLLAVFVLPLPFILIHPWIGVIVWAWLGVMNPHRLTFGFAQSLPFAAVVATLTLIGLVLTKDERRVKGGGLMFIFILLIAWMNVTTVLAINEQAAWRMWDRVMKIQLFTFLAIFLLHARRQLEALVWTIALSLGFYAVKGAVFTIRTAGTGRVSGPESSMIEDNNHFGLAVIICIPLMVYLYRVSTGRLRRAALATMAAMSALCVLGTYSRGAFLGLTGMALVLWARSRSRIRSGIAIVIIALIAVPFMPDKWEERMMSTTNYEEDGSAQGRITAWKTAINIAMDRPFGAGFEHYSPLVSALYSPVPNEVRAAHSIYFQMLAEHGFVGLGLFLLLWVSTWFTASKVRSIAAAVPDLAWAHLLASMIQVSLAGYAVGGAFLSMAHYDVVYFLFAIVVCLRHIVGEQQTVPAEQRSSLRWKTQVG